MRAPRSRMATVTAVLGLVAVLVTAVTASSPPAGAPYAARAAAAYRAMQRYLYLADGSSLYRERYPPARDDNRYSYEWPFSQAHIATLDLAGIGEATAAVYRADLDDRASGQERYWNAGGGSTGRPGYESYPRAPFGRGGIMYHDDNEWVGLAKIQQYLMTGDRDALARAKDVFALVVAGWDDDDGHPSPGGVFWSQGRDNDDRNTVSNLPAAQLGLRLYQVTHEDGYLRWAQRLYDWTNEHMLADDDLYRDHVDLHGVVDETRWSYNQGVAVGVETLLYQVTHDHVHLQRAERIATAAYDFYVAHARLAGQPIYFNTIFFKNLLLLESVTGGHMYRDAMRDYADRVWHEYRDRATGLVHFDGDGATETIQQAALVQLNAVLAWPTERVGRLY